jgi:hypothetical protein
MKATTARVVLLACLALVGVAAAQGECFFLEKTHIRGSAPQPPPSRLANPSPTEKKKKKKNSHTEKKTLRSTAAALSAAGGTDIVFPLRSALGPLDPKNPPPLPSSASVDLSALTSPGLRLDNTARRSLGLAARLTRLGPCTGLGPFVPTAPGLLYVLDSGSGADARVEVGVALAPGAAGENNTNNTHVSHAASPGDAAALWPGVTGYVANAGCGPVEFLSVFGGDDGGLVFPAAAWAAGAPAGAAGGSAGGAGDGARFVVDGCVSRCGLGGAEASAPAAAAAAAVAPKPAAAAKPRA